MQELITQYGPYIFVVLAAFFLFAAGHHVGANTAATAKPDLKVVPAEPSKTEDIKSACACVLPLAKVPDNLDNILPAAPVAVENPVPVPDAPKPATTGGIDAEVAKAHDALDKAGVFGPNRLVAIAAVRAGQVTGDDIARAHPVAQTPKREIAPLVGGGSIAEDAHTAAQ